MGQQRNAPVTKRLAQTPFGYESINAKSHGHYDSREFKRKAIGMMKIRVAGWVRQCPI
jgi:hypothetical protein